MNASQKIKTDKPTKKKDVIKKKKKERHCELKTAFRTLTTFIVNPSQGQKSVDSNRK